MLRKEHFLQYCDSLELLETYMKLNEEKGTIQIQEGKDVSDKIDSIINDINKLFTDEEFSNKHLIKDKEKYGDVIEYRNLSDIYELNYINLFDWFLHLRILVQECEMLEGFYNGNSYTDDIELSCYIKNKILYGTIILINPSKNNKLKDTIYHELRHYFRAFKTYQSNSHFIKNEFDLKHSHRYANYDFTNYDKIIEELNDNDINVSKYNLEKFIFCSFYFLNYNEMEARQENIFSELKRGETETLNAYNNIFKVTQYLYENDLPCEHAVIADDITRKRLQKAMNLQSNAGKTSLNFIYKKFFKKYSYLIKHINAMKDFLGLKND